MRVIGSETQGFVVHWHLIYERRSWSSKLSRSSVGMKERAVYTAGSRGSLAALQALRFDRGDGKIWRMSKPSTSFKNSLPRRRKRGREKEIERMYLCMFVCMYTRKLILARSHLVSFDFVLIALSASLFFSFSFPLSFAFSQRPLFLHTVAVHRCTTLWNSQTDATCARCKIGIYWDYGNVAILVHFKTL